ncbi:MAG TPA: Uma2 family endonuclease [Geminicoccaceae bacterium]
MADATASSGPVLATVEDFLAWVEPQAERYEFVDGRLVLMAGGSEQHNDIQVNLLSALRRRLRGTPCKPNGSDLLIRIDDRTGRFPDASVSCGREGGHAITSPVAVFEILSPTTELLDRSGKRRDYQRLPSLQHYVLIAQDTARVEIYTRREAGWGFQEIDDMAAAIPLDALGIDLPLAEIYDAVPLTNEEEPATPA